VESSPSEVTALLTQLSKGNKTVIERLMPLVYDELHRRASIYMRQERADHTLQTTALVHEAYLKLVGQREASFKNRAHFFAIASQLMRRILIDHARVRLSAKRGGEQNRIALEDVSEDRLERMGPLRADTPRGMIAVDDALHKLKILDSRQEQIVEMRFFGGLTVEETAEVLGVSTRTIEREWTMARAWLYIQLKEHVNER
jgi:RNA polymerase sigma factor (TIGR02999 family)